MQRGLAKPDEILVLAYARDARQELEDRIAARIGVRVDVRTFHSLGMAIVGEATGRMPTVSKAASDQKELDRRLARYLDDALADDRTRQAVVEFFSHHLTPPEPTDTFKTANEHYRYLKAHGIRTLKGELVKSQQEQQIANWLLLHGIQYAYEQPYPVADTANKDHRAYEPDFFLPEHDIYIEHFGVDRQGTTAPWVDRPAYHEGMRWKRALHAEQGTDLVETFSYQFTEGTVFRELQAALERLDVVVEPLSTDKVRSLILDSPDATPFLKLVSTFLSLYCCSGLKMKDLQARGATSAHPERARVFLDVFSGLVDRYRQELEDESAIDFSDMIRLATGAVTKGTYRSAFKHIIVDEFQDIAVVAVPGVA